MLDERALAFDCEGETLVGILSPAAAPARRGVLVIVGGPQYRAGSHRQFALLARRLAAQGIPALRFDYRGLGDSTGAARTFEDVAADIRSAIDAFQAALPGLQEVVLWGLCDAAAAALAYGQHDRRVAGLVLLNPWARSAAGLARSTLKHYYWARLRDPALWRKLARGQFALGASLRSLLGLVGAARQARDGSAPPLTPDLHARLLAGMRGFQGRVLFIFSSADLTAQEFLDMCKASPGWQRLLAQPTVQQHTLDGADHTFSRRAWRDQVADWTGAWVAAW